MWIKLLWVFFLMHHLGAASNEITVGLSADYPPFEFKQGEDIVGFDVDLAKAIGEEIGVSIKIQDMSFASLLSALKQNDVDVIISSVTSTQERKKSFDFSIPYHFDELAILHHENQPISEQNLNGKTIACQMGSAMHTWLTEHTTKTKIVPMDVATQMAEALKAGHVDGVLIDAIQAREFIKNSKNLAFSVIGRSKEGCSVMTRKGSPLVTKINAAITKLKQNGTLDNLHKKWIEGDSQSKSHTLLKDFIFIAKGLPTTLTYSFLSILFGGFLGIFFAVSRHLHHGTWAIASIISIIRGTPVLLQLGFVYFSLPALIGIKLSVLAAGVITLGINSAAYITEILRSGLQSLPKGQFEACQALGVSKWHSWKDIILPQVFRNVFPSLINEAVTLTKETALISVLGEMDILRRAQALAAETYDYFLPMCLAGCVYYLLVKTIEFFGKTLEKRWYHA
jgi:His/Glu/Gln/Arg/opine family amino acid ABC transporter permease subunit